MIITVVLFLISAPFRLIFADHCESCPVYLKHYTELGCRPVFQSPVDCCPKKFDCPRFIDLDKTQCHYRGTSYEQHIKLPDDLLLDCTQSCKCLSFRGVARFICEPTTCTESLSRFEGHCVFERSLDECCATHIECDKNQIKSMHQCNIDGISYQQGEIIYPWNDQCYSCICDRNFINTSVIADNRNCRENKNCNIELHSLSKFQRGCAPVYYGNNPCCPSSWRCPQPNDIVIKSAIEDTSDSTCEFGSIKFAKGDRLGDNCLNCSCLVPPLLSCTQNDDC